MAKEAPVGTVREVKGSFKGSKQNGGRPITVFHKKMADGSWSTTSSNTARVKYQKKTRKKLSKDQDVDHPKNGDGRKGKDVGLKVLSHSANVAKGNKDRTKKKK